MWFTNYFYTCSVIPYIIEDYGGILVEVGDINGMIKAINILQNQELRDRMSSWNQEKVIKSYSTELVIGKIFTEYSDFGVKVEKNLEP